MDSDISHLLRHSVVDVECKHECLACGRFEVCIPPLPSGPGGIGSPVESVSVPKFKSPDGFLTCIHALSARTDVVRKPQRSIPIPQSQSWVYHMSDVQGDSSRPSRRACGIRAPSTPHSALC